MEAFSARVAYNWRSEYMIRELPGFSCNREHQAYWTVDLSANYHITDYLSVTFEVVNLLEEDSVQLGVAPDAAEVKPALKNGYPAWSFEGEARYKVGVALRFYLYLTFNISPALAGFFVREYAWWIEANSSQ